MRFSILTPSYNYARFLPDALESVARQEGVDVEHIVVDDGSTDESVAVLREWRSPLRVEVQRNAGLACTLNHALALATGDVVGWLNADDFYLPGTLARVEQAFLAEPGVDVIFGDSVFVDAQAHALRLAPQHPMNAVVLRCWESFVAPCASFRRREILPLPAWDERLRVLMDWDQDLRLLSAGAKYRYLPLTLAAFRRHSAQQSALRLPDDELEAQRVVRRHGLPLQGWRRRPSSALGHAMHAACKAAAGSYRRQLAARNLRGRDTRWWATEEGAATVSALLAL
jgi:glycosyltransferase involved in cell wall biosynthesis